VRGRCQSAGRDFPTSSSNVSAPDTTSLFPAGQADPATKEVAYVPRHADATDTSTAELRDARLIIARELG
jgi:hypothetical protein